jgi:2-methylcitrate synthase/citrate synthase II
MRERGPEDMKTEAFSPGLEGVIAGATTISDVDPERSRLLYRGYDIADLTEHACFEEVAYLLLFGQLPTPRALAEFRQTLSKERHLPQSVMTSFSHFPSDTHPMDLIRYGVAHLSLLDPENRDSSHEANVRKAVRLLAKMPALVSQSFRVTRGLSAMHDDLDELSHAERFLYLTLGKRPDRFEAHLFDVSLIAYAEHGFNASTFAARVTVSTLSDLYSGIVSAIGTLKGPLHGGANEEAMKMLLEIDRPENARNWIHNALTTKRKIMGFGHREYKIGDPRARLLSDWGRRLSEHMGNTRWYNIANTVEEVMVNEKRIYPNVDFPTAYIYYLMGLPIDLYTPIFALARVVGWSAHIIEQLEHNRLFRPKALYEGPKPRDFVPLNQR